MTNTTTLRTAAQIARSKRVARATIARLDRLAFALEMLDTRGGGAAAQERAQLVHRTMLVRLHADGLCTAWEWAPTLTDEGRSRQAEVLAEIARAEAVLDEADHPTAEDARRDLDRLRFTHGVLPEGVEEMAVEFYGRAAAGELDPTPSTHTTWAHYALAAVDAGYPAGVAL